MDYIINHARPHFLSSVEETLNDTAVLLASLIESDLRGPVIDPRRIRTIFTNASQKEIRSQIFSTEKNEFKLDLYVVNLNGIVIFDSRGKNEGKDFSKWNDVLLTLQGKYGARSTRLDNNDPQSSSFFIAAPVVYNGKIIGAVTVIKPKKSISPFMENAKSEVARMAGIVLATLVLAAFLITFWFTRPISALTKYAEDLRIRKKAVLPNLGRSEIRDLGEAFEKLRIELEGKKYVEDYITTLTHEIKSPLSSIRAASELLEEGIAEEEKKERLHSNIQNGIRRITEITEKMLSLSALENRENLIVKEPFYVTDLCMELVEGIKSQIEAKNILLSYVLEDEIYFKGDKFLIRQAFLNLIDNALEFTPKKGKIEISLKSQNSSIVFAVSNSGPSIPEYALERIFEKFFSLPRPSTERRSTGLGLAFTKEISLLHGGEVEVINTDGGVISRIILHA